MEREPDQYLMIINGVRRWMPIGEADVAYDDGFSQVSIGGYVREANGAVERRITDGEARRIAEIADAWSDDK